LLGLFFDPEDGGYMFLRNSVPLSADHTAIYPRSLPQILQSESRKVSTSEDKLKHSDFNLSVLHHSEEVNAGPISGLFNYSQLRGSIVR
jgi:hypothetical protein